jgi:hypothetical protein
MSVDALSWAKKQKTGGPAPKCLLLALADYADEDGICWPSQETLAKVTEQSVDSVQRQLKQLEAIPLIERRGRGLRNGRRAVTKYTLMMPVTTASANGTTPQITAPQIAVSPITTPQTGPDDTAQLCGKNRQIEPSKDSLPSGERDDEPILASHQALSISSKARQTELPTDWMPTALDLEFARGEGLGDDAIRREIGKFKDYWPNAPTARRKKVDWSATWRNWIRRAAEQKRPHSGNSNGARTRGSALDGFDQIGIAVDAGLRVPPRPI